MMWTIVGIILIMVAAFALTASVLKWQAYGGHVTMKVLARFYTSVVALIFGCLLYTASAITLTQPREVILFTPVCIVVAVTSIAMSVIGAVYFKYILEENL